MSQAFDQIVQQIGALSEDEKVALRIVLDKSPAAPANNGIGAGKVSAFGWAQGRVAMRADFGAPLEDFKEYTE